MKRSCTCRIAVALRVRRRIGLRAGRGGGFAAGAQPRRDPGRRRRRGRGRQPDPRRARRTSRTCGSSPSAARTPRPTGRRTARRLIFQSTRDGWPCDQIFVLDLGTGQVRARVSTGKGRTTCGYFYDRDQRVLFASTHLGADACPPPPDYSQGYVWPVYAGYDIFTAKPDGSDLKRLTDTPGYDAEATRLDRREVDRLHLGARRRPRPLHDEARRQRRDPPHATQLGYDGGAFFSRDGKWICCRADHPADSAAIADYRALLAQASGAARRRWTCG